MKGVMGVLMCVGTTRKAWNDFRDELLDVVKMHPDAGCRIEEHFDNILTSVEVVMGNREDDKFYTFIHRNDNVDEKKELERYRKLHVAIAMEYADQTQSADESLGKIIGRIEDFEDGK